MLLFILSDHQVCAKCGKKEEIVARPGPTPTERAQMDSKFQQELKSLSERKRRTFLRYLEKLDKAKSDNGLLQTKKIYWSLINFLFFWGCIIS